MQMGNSNQIKFLADKVNEVLKILKKLMKKFLNRFIGYLPFIACFLVLYWNPIFASFALRNLITQIIIFILLACIPAYFTNKMYFVDIAWPWGLFAIGIQILFFGSEASASRYFIGGMYILAGLRMGLMGIMLLRYGVLKRDLPRYQFQRIHWKRGGYKSEALSIQYEILVQGLANASVLAMPAFLQAFNPSPTLSIFEIIFYFGWLISICLEMLSDIQKMQFAKKMRESGEKNKVCDVGLWKYSRHPNYFFEWMVWNFFILSSIPSLINLFSQDQFLYWGIITICLLYVSKIMYTTLVDYTGARPSEYYTVKKRPSYKEYQKTTNMFFPGPRKL
jgi:steroid 5-alpha reductase family enzyme